MTTLTEDEIEEGKQDYREEFKEIYDTEVEEQLHEELQAADHVTREQLKNYRLEARRARWSGRGEQETGE